MTELDKNLSIWICLINQIPRQNNGYPYGYERHKKKACFINYSATL